MDIQEKCRCRRCSCTERVVAFFVLLLALALGLIFGAMYYETILSAMAAVVVFAAVMGVAVIALLIYGSCRGCWGRLND